MDVEVPLQVGRGDLIGEDLREGVGAEHLPAEAAGGGLRGEGGAGAGLGRQRPLDGLPGDEGPGAAPRLPEAPALEELGVHEGGEERGGNAADPGPAEAGLHTLDDGPRLGGGEAGLGGHDPGEAIRGEGGAALRRRILDEEEAVVEEGGGLHGEAGGGGLPQAHPPLAVEDVGLGGACVAGLDQHLLHEVLDLLDGGDGEVRTIGELGPCGSIPGGARVRRGEPESRQDRAPGGRGAVGEEGLHQEQRHHARQLLGQEAVLPPHREGGAVDGVGDLPLVEGDDPAVALADVGGPPHDAGLSSGSASPESGASDSAAPAPPASALFFGGRRRSSSATSSKSSTSSKAR